MHPNPPKRAPKSYPKRAPKSLPQRVPKRAPKRGRKRTAQGAPGAPGHQESKRVFEKLPKVLPQGLPKGLPKRVLKSHIWGYVGLRGLLGGLLACGAPGKPPEAIATSPLDNRNSPIHFATLPLRNRISKLRGPAAWAPPVVFPGVNSPTQPLAGQNSRQL